MNSHPSNAMLNGLTSQFTPTVTAIPRHCRRTWPSEARSTRSSIGTIIAQMSTATGRLTCATSRLPMAASAHQLFLAAAAAGHGGRDDAFVIRVWEALTGIELPAKKD